jgi:hypothetical protein
MHTMVNGSAEPWGGTRSEWLALPAHSSGENQPSDNWARIGDAIRATMAAFMEANPVAAGNAKLTSSTFEAEARNRIEAFVGREYKSSPGTTSNGSVVAEDAARQCALGNPAACN